MKAMQVNMEKLRNLELESTINICQNCKWAEKNQMFTQILPNIHKKEII